MVGAGDDAHRYARCRRTDVEYGRIDCLEGDLQRIVVEIGEAAGTIRCGGDRLSYRLVGAETEEIFGLGAYERPRTWSVVDAEDARVDTAYHRGRPSGQLPGRQLGSTRDLVGDRGCGHEEFVAVRVGLACVRTDRHDARASDRDVGLSDAPGSSGRIGDNDSEVLDVAMTRSEEHTSELQSRGHLVCRLLLE